MRQPTDSRRWSHWRRDSCVSPDLRPARRLSTLISSSRSGQWIPSPRAMRRQFAALRCCPVCQTREPGEWHRDRPAIRKVHNQNLIGHTDLRLRIWYSTSAWSATSAASSTMPRPSHLVSPPRFRRTGIWCVPDFDISALPRCSCPTDCPPPPLWSFPKYACSRASHSADRARASVAASIRPWPSTTSRRLTLRCP